MDSLARRRKFNAIKEAESNGEVADSMDVRKVLIARFYAGEITLEQMQSELKSIKKSAGKLGLTTRNQVFYSS